MKADADERVDDLRTLRQEGLDPPTHRRILTFLNAAAGPEDLVHRRPKVVGDHAAVHEKGHDFAEVHPEQILDFDVAREIIAFRDDHFPFGFRHIRELFDLDVLIRDHWKNLLHHFSNSFYGSWAAFPHPIPRRGPGGGYDGVVHAALLHTGKVLFITADETTLLWDPENATAASFEDPVNQPHDIPDPASGYSVLCSGHSFLSDGRLLAVGGGGYGPHSLARWGYKFDPVSQSWSRTAGSMPHDRWYPTVLTLGDQRLGNGTHEVLVVCGHGSGDMEIYDETTDTFREITGDAKGFPALYPGLHLLPNHSVFYSRTGWGSPGGGGGPFTGDDQSSFFSLTGPDSGVWTDIAPVGARPDRTKGMSVMLLSSTPPYVRILVVGGAEATNNDTYETIDVTTLSPASNWSAAAPYPDGEHRSLASAVLLPDGKVFVAGGIDRTNSPCATFDPQTNSWSGMATLPSIRGYHSVALLLPSGKVMMAGWNSTTIEIYSPPYLFGGARPAITSAPSLVHHGQSFVIESPDADSIVKVVLVRPMAVTHQTDTEQKVLEMPYVHDHANPTRLTLTAPDGGHPHSLAQQGYYMMFAINNQGVPSVANWIYLH